VGTPLRGFCPPYECRISSAFVAPVLNLAVVNALAHESVRRRLADLGQEAPAHDRQTPAALAQYQASEVQKRWPIVKSMNLKPE
jgi:hypothetical protein